MKMMIPKFESLENLWGPSPRFHTRHRHYAAKLEGKKCVTEQKNMEWNQHTKPFGLFRILFRLRELFFKVLNLLFIGVNGILV